MTKQKLVIGYLYPDLMNIYGDTGNIICLTKRCEWRGIEVEVKNISIGDKLKKGECDLFFFGGGQDQAQNDVAADLGKSGKGKVLRGELERGVPMLSICGGYQLLGDHYEPLEGPKLEGLGFLPVFTKANTERMIGNLVIDSEFGKLVGFENHS
jgi:lipid II isoglutaminyl synthase (glutamine-hydrolysing)